MPPLHLWYISLLIYPAALFALTNMYLLYFNTYKILLGIIAIKIRPNAVLLYMFVTGYVLRSFMLRKYLYFNYILFLLTKWYTSLCKCDTDSNHAWVCRQDISNNNNNKYMQNKLNINQINYINNQHQAFWMKISALKQRFLVLYRALVKKQVYIRQSSKQEAFLYKILFSNQ